MKNKKSKIIVPAIALVLLSTAASISGSVAWFTASRTAQIKAGPFSVVKTGDNLKVTLTAVAGTEITGSVPEQAVVQKTGYNLTDASFDFGYHATTEEGFTTWKSPYVVTPDVPREKVDAVTQLGTTIEDNALVLQGTSAMETSLNRGTGVYSAYMWNMTFEIAFSASSTKPQGLFLDLADKDTYMNAGSEEIANGASIAGLYDNPKCTGEPGGETAKNTTGETKTYYHKPVDTGKGFRIAFIPTAVPTGSMGYAKVWSAHEGEPTPVTGEGKYVKEMTVGEVLTAAAYGTSTLAFNGTAFSSVTCNQALLKYGDNDGVPADNTISAATALSSNKNFLGYFALNAGGRVEITYTCVAWYEGTHPNVQSTNVLEDITSSMKFGVCNLTGLE